MATTHQTCCCNPLTPVECILDTVAIRKIRSRGGPGLPACILFYDADGAFTTFEEPDPDRYVTANAATRTYCFRLYVFETIVVAGNSYGSHAPDFVLKTNRRASIDGFVPTPFETTPGSGILLDDPPYWWTDCQWGGYVDGGPMWHTITSDMIDSRRTTVLADGMYTLLALVEFSHWKKNSFDGGGVIVGITDGEVALRGVKHVRYA